MEVHNVGEKLYVTFTLGVQLTEIAGRKPHVTVP
jgi:hypothetical protein